MKTLSLLQPWATLVAIRAKRIETCSWSTSYRGPLAIHASKRMPAASKELIYENPFWLALLDMWKDDPEKELPLGCVIATCELTNCIRVPDFPCTFPVDDRVPANGSRSLSSSRRELQSSPSGITQRGATPGCSKTSSRWRNRSRRGVLSAFGSGSHESENRSKGSLRSELRSVAL